MALDKIVLTLKLIRPVTRESPEGSLKTVISGLQLVGLPNTLPRLPASFWVTALTRELLLS